MHQSSKKRIKNYTEEEPDFFIYVIGQVVIKGENQNRGNMWNNY